MKIQHIPSRLVLLTLLLTFSIATVHPTKMYKEPFMHNKLVGYISYKYKINQAKAKEIVILAKRNSHENKFPRLHDTLAIIAIESGFKETAISKCNAKGLMQVLYIPVSFDPKLNIAAGTALLKEYSQRLPNTDAAVQSYNVGITNFKKGMRNKNYLHKFKQEKEELKNADLFQ